MLRFNNSFSNYMGAFLIPLRWQKGLPEYQITTSKAHVGEHEGATTATVNIPMYSTIFFLSTDALVSQCSSPVAKTAWMFYLCWSSLVLFTFWCHLISLKERNRFESKLTSVRSQNQKHSQGKILDRSGRKATYTVRGEESYKQTGTSENFESRLWASYT